MFSSLRWACALAVLVAFATLADTQGKGHITVSKPFLIDSSVSDMKWLHGAKKTDSKVVIVRSRMGSVYRSSDDGKTWASLVDAITADGMSVDEAKIASLHVSKASNDMVVLRGFGKYTWFSRDRGANFIKRDFADFVDLHLHPTNPQMLLATKYDGEYPHRELTLYMSEDFGETWKKLVARIRECSWGNAGKGDEPQSSIYCTIHDAMEKSETFREWDVNLHFYKSIDFFSTMDKMVAHGNRFNFHDNYLFVAAINPDEPTEIVLKVSTDGCKTFHTTQFPYQLTQRSYTVLDTSEGAVYVQVKPGREFVKEVQHDEESNLYANIYVSGPKGTRYALSLKRVVKDWRGVADFENVNGVEGVFIANVADEHLQNTPDIPKRTVITFDKGAFWQPLTPPEYDSLGRSAVGHCKDCTLHLNGKTSWSFGPVYSSPSSTGLILATGNIGHHVHTREDEVNTYFSRDSGKTWSEVVKGSHIYEFADHGGLMVVADNTHRTKQILYSWNEGTNFTKFVFWNHHIEVENIITEPSGTSQIMILYGRRHGKGIMVQLDFSTLHERQCMGMDAPDSEDSDYELYSPADTLNPGKCLLGRKESITRRKRGSSCFNGVEFDRQQFVHNCPCTEADYECDFGHERAADGTCKLMADAPPVNTNAPSTCSGSYFVTKGYRRIPGDVCEGGVDHDQVEMPCPGVNVVSLILLFILVSIAALLAVFTYYKRSVDYYNMPSWMRWFDATLAHGVGYARMSNQPESAMEDDFGLGDDEEEGEAEVLQDTAIRSFTSSSFQGEESRVNLDVKVPALRPPPRGGASTTGEFDDFDSAA